jgi:hypothetical protein|tara:strand:+ start:281 stop:547 length:267 start_codon:yes stop_codon:yes gene_type:complete
MTIPKITKETVQSVTVSIEHDPEFFDKFLLKVREDNHLVFELIQVVKKIAEESGNPVIAESYMKGICTVYKLIESQMESEEMNLFWGD